MKYRSFQRALSKRVPFGIFYDLGGDFIDTYSALDCRQDLASIAARVDDQIAGRT